MGKPETMTRPLMFQHEPYTDEARRRLAEALRLYRDLRPQVEPRVPVAG